MPEPWTLAQPVRPCSMLSEPEPAAQPRENPPRSLKRAAERDRGVNHDPALHNLPPTPPFKASERRIRSMSGLEVEGHLRSWTGWRN